MAESARAGHLRRTYALTEAQYDALLKRQRGRCAVCRRSPTSRRLEVDHDHKSMKVRGLLCWYCNKKVIGRATEPGIFESAAEYLRQPPAFDILGPHLVPKKKPRKRRSRK